MLSITYSQVRGITAGDSLEIKQSKTQKHRRVTINRSASQEIAAFIKHNCDYFNSQERDCHFFYSRKGGVLSVPSISRMVKGWCQSVGLSGNYGSHTLRKTWGYWQYQRGTHIPLLMEAFGHSTQKQTMAYLCIQAKEIQEIFDLEL